MGRTQRICMEVDRGEAFQGVSEGAECAGGSFLPATSLKFPPRNLRPGTLSGLWVRRLSKPRCLVVHSIVIKIFINRYKIGVYFKAGFTIL